MALIAEPAPNHYCAHCNLSDQLPEPEDTQGGRWNCERCGMLMYEASEIEIIVTIRLKSDGSIATPPKEVDRGLPFG